MIETLLLFLFKAAVIFGCIFWIGRYLLERYIAHNTEVARFISAKGIDPQMSAAKLQALERLTLFCERISIPKLIRRIKVANMSANDLKQALYIAIQQEHDHNITQQIYVSDSLWGLIQMARNQVLNIITVAASEIDSDASADKLEDLLYDKLSEIGKDPVKTAQEGIAAETKLVVG